MTRILPRAACAAALLFCSVSVDAIATHASAQGYFQIGFETFHDRLANYGDWVYSDRWGEVWLPANVPDGFRPYDTDGYWAYTDQYGWYWVSNYEWGDIAFHYGRWVNDPDDGWLWIPGYVWSPAWVVWRSNGNYTGWMAMPPDDAFLGRSAIGVGVGGLGISIAFNDVGGFYGYSRWYGRDYDRDRFAANWVFVPTGHMADRDLQRYVAPRQQYVTMISNTKNITNYSVVNNYVVNRGVDVHQVQRASGHPVVAMRASDVIRNPQLVTRADEGRQIQMRVRAENPHGNGLANSAPAPSPKVVQSLSTELRAHPVSAATGAGRPPRHLFTRTTVESAPLAPRRGAQGNTPGAGLTGAGQGGTNNAAGNGATASGMQGPMEERRRANSGEMLGTGAATTSTPTGKASGESTATGMQGAMERHHRASGGEMPGTGASTTSIPAGNASGESTATGMQGAMERHRRGGRGGGSETPGTGAATTATTTGNAPPGESTSTTDTVRHRQGMSAPSDLSGATMNGPGEQPRHRHQDNGVMGSGTGNAPSGGTSGGMMNASGESRRLRHEDNTGIAAGGTGGNAMAPVVQRHAGPPAPGGDNGAPREKRHNDNAPNPHGNGASNPDQDQPQNPQ